MDIGNAISASPSHDSPPFFLTAWGQRRNHAKFDREPVGVFFVVLVYEDGIVDDAGCVFHLKCRQDTPSSSAADARVGKNARTSWLA